MYSYGPPDSDSSDDDYDGFYFGGPGVDEKPKERSNLWFQDPEQELYDAVQNGDLEEVKKQILVTNFDINQLIKGGSTLLQYACRYGYFDIAEYLLESKANPNRQADSVTPLMDACSCTKDGSAAKKIVQLLLEKGAVVNVSDKFGMTPFIFACKSGNVDVVKLLIKEASFEAADNQGCTALFHAIENNHPEVVKVLVKAGINTGIANRKGYTPKQVAEFCGYQDIVELLPKEEYKYLVPTTYLTYNSFHDYIPRIFLKSETPEYFQEISRILSEIDMHRFIDNFGSARIDLAHFLCMTDDDLMSVGLEFPFHRSKIKLGLLNFLLTHWSKRLIGKIARNGSETFYDILLLSANHVQNLVVISAALKFIQHNIDHGICGKLEDTDVVQMKETIKKYKAVVLQLNKTAKYLSTFTPRKPPLLVDYNLYKAKQRRYVQVRNCIKYSIFIGVSIVIYLRVKRHL